MNQPEGFGLNHPESWAPHPPEPQPRAVGSPLPVGAGGASSLSPTNGDSRRATVGALPGRAPARPPGRALANSSADSNAELPSSVQRAVNALRVALPFVQRILPLLDGTIATQVSNLLTPHPQSLKPSPPVNLAPIEDGLADLRTQHRDLRSVVVEQNASLKRVEDQLEMVREATDRNTLEQQELLEDLKSVGGKVNMFAILALALLAVSILLNVILYLHIQRVLP